LSPPIWEPGTHTQGFSIERVEPIPEIRLTAYLGRHEQTGARFLHLHCDNREKVFAIAFMTPPHNSSGLPHILEHSVLAGSVNYPLKDVFNELHRGSLQTFINAFTYPDRTVYPVASQVPADFFNLARVYADLAFHPLLREETFAQEGYHFEFSVPDDLTSPLTVSGVVYNEMKGAYSSPDNLMFKAIQEHILPDTTYRFDAGGAPEEIIRLTYDEFLAFHRNYYSPANAFFYLYGDTPPPAVLAFLAEILTRLTPRSVVALIRPQPRWTTPRVVRTKFPILQEEDPRKKGVVNIAWMLVDNGEIRENLILQILSGILVGTAASPLRKALIDSRLGEDLSPVTGFEGDLRDTLFVVGLRGMNHEQAEDVEDLIMSTLRETVRQGIDCHLTEAILHQVEFAGKEISRGLHPYGLKLMGLVFQTWPYGGDPLRIVNFPKEIEHIRAQWSAHPHLFEEAIEKWLLENPHRLRSVMEPSPTYLEERERYLEEVIAARCATMTAEDRKQIKDNLERLRRYQQTPDPPEAISSLPRLTRQDLERTIELIPTEVRQDDDVTYLRHDIFTNGIAYIDLLFDLSSVPEELMPLLPIWGHLITHVGAAGLSYEEMAKQIALKTGGVGMSPLCNSSFPEGQGLWQRMALRTKALYRNVGDAIAILSDLLLSPDFTDERRMEDLLMEQKNDLLAAIIPSGHIIAKRLAGASLSPVTFREEQWWGRTQLLALSATIEAFRSNPHGVIEKFLRLNEVVVQRGRLVVNITADEEGLLLMERELPALVDPLHRAAMTVESVNPALSERRHRGIIVPAEVSYVAGAVRVPSFGTSEEPSLRVAQKYLANGYLYRTIRVQGGAYGGSCTYDPGAGIYAFISYRDPHIISTIQAFREATISLKREDIEEDEVEKQ